VNGVDDPVVNFFTSTAPLARLERCDEALAGLEDARRLGPIRPEQLLADPDFTILRNHSRFLALLQPPVKSSLSSWFDGWSLLRLIGQGTNMNDNKTPPQPVEQMLHLAKLFANAGVPTERAFQSVLEVHGANPEVHVEAAVAYAMAGDDDMTIHKLKDAMQRGFVDAGRICNEPAFSRLREHEGIVSVVATLTQRAAKYVPTQ